MSTSKPTKHTEEKTTKPKEEEKRPWVKPPQNDNDFWEPPLPCCYIKGNRKICGRPSVKGYNMCYSHYALPSEDYNEAAKQITQKQYEKLLEENGNVKTTKLEEDSENPVKPQKVGMIPPQYTEARKIKEELRRVKSENVNLKVSLDMVKAKFKEIENLLEGIREQLNDSDSDSASERIKKKKPVKKEQQKKKKPTEEDEEEETQEDRERYYNSTKDKRDLIDEYEKEITLFNKYFNLMSEDEKNRFTRIFDGNETFEDTTKLSKTGQKCYLHLKNSNDIRDVGVENENIPYIYFLELSRRINDKDVIGSRPFKY